ncbi:hypothetical protein [Methylomonas sp. AM2-LC]|uniref:hypothetical protein n=1 Tax=Methylomonas sp. AM2-LC TaxID=3153301 RepID=UPI003264ED06
MSKFKVFPVLGGTDWTDDPGFYVTDPSKYATEISKGRAALELSGAGKIEFYLVGEPAGAGFLDADEFPDFLDDENKSEPTLYYVENGTKVPAQLVDVLSRYAPTWQGPSLEVTSDSATLLWSSKYTNDELRVDVESIYPNVIKFVQLEHYSGEFAELVD